MNTHSIFWGQARLGDGITRTLRLDITGNQLAIYCWRKGIDWTWRLLATTDALAWAIGFMNQMLGWN